MILISCDLSLASDREALYNWISLEHNDLNVLINNAGIQQWMSINDIDFIETIFEQLEQDKTELTSGFSEAMIKAGPQDLQKTFDRMNNPER